MDPATAESENGPVGPDAYVAKGDEVKVISVDGPVLELADGTRLVPDGDGKPARIEDGSHVFTLADALGASAQPFAGYVRR